MSKILNSVCLHGTTESIGVMRKPLTRRRSATPLPARYRNRPSAIRTGIIRIWESSAELGFSKATTAVLQAILALGVSSTQPFDPVFAKKQTLARTAAVSNTTLYRALRFLESEGWISRAPQQRLKDGSLDLGEIFITKRLAILTGLVIDERLDKNIALKNVSKCAACPPGSPRLSSSGINDSISAPPALLTLQPNIKAPERKMVDGMVDGPIYKEQSCYQKTTVSHQSANSAFVRKDGRSVPAELLWLITENRLTYGGLFDLMKKAKAVTGQQLSDYVAYRSERIRQLNTVSDCYKYLLSLIQQRIDAKYLCAQRHKRVQQEERKHQERLVSETRASWCRANDGQSFINPLSDTTFKVIGAYGLIEIANMGNLTSRRCMKITSRFISAVEDGRLQKFIKPTVPLSMTGPKIAALLFQLKGRVPASSPTT